ncbi:MAG: ATP-binding protein, partial [Candidatus Omnitrophota bacterium]
TSQELKDITKANKEMVEIFLSDKYGGLVAASGKTTDFYQADEPWWQSAFAEGKSEIFIGDIEFDESSNTSGMTFALPIKDDAGRVIGIAKAVIDIQLLFSFLKDFKFGHTGYAALVNKDGYIVVYKGIKPLTRKFMPGNNFKEILRSKIPGIIIDKSAISPHKIFSAFTKINYPFFLKRGLAWWVFVGQDSEEAFWPLYRLILQALGLTAFLLVLVPLLGFIFGSKIALPIEKLKEASDRITKGDLDYPIRVKTGDELEKLANSLQVMSLSIKEREGLLIAQKAYSQGIVASMVDALFVLNPDARLKSVNKSTLDLLGYKEDELIGQLVNKIFLQGEEELQQCFQNIIDKGAAYNISLTFITKEGKKIPVDLSGAVMRERGEIIGIVGVARDMRQIAEVISDLENKKKKLEEHDSNLIRMQRAMLHIMDDLQEVSRARAQFIGMVSHELRTPLTAIKEGVAVVLDKITGSINKEQQKYLEIAVKNVDRLGRLINGVLDFQALESGKMKFKIEENDINEAVKEIQRTILPLTKKNNLDFVCQLDENLPRIKFDYDKIIQVLTNLVNNALKFTERGGIAITTGKGNNFIQVTVQDTGPGIKEEDMQKLFQEFVQLQRRVGGTGLGLSICKKIIEAHRGKIWAESPPAGGGESGKGTAFHFTLPIKERRA